MRDLTGTVVAIFDAHHSGREALEALAAEEFSAELMYGEEGRAHLTREDEVGLSAVLQKLALAFGDEVRILERLEQALEEGSAVISVDVEDEGTERVSLILEEHGGHDMWRLGELTFNRIGSEGSGEG
ncbi:MAG: hypothetical protein ACRDX9_08570 [Acidimicrobiia bacterium]